MLHYAKTPMKMGLKENTTSYHSLLLSSYYSKLHAISKVALDDSLVA